MTTCSTLCAVILQKSFTCFPSKLILHKATQTFIEAHKHPSYLPAPRKVSTGEWHQPWPQSHQGAAEGRKSLHCHVQTPSPRHLCVLKEHLTTVRRLSFLRQTTPTVLVTAEIQTLRIRKKTRFLYWNVVK